MKIAYFLDIPRGLGGAGNLLLQQAWLMSKLHDVVVAVPCGDDGVGNWEYIKRCLRKGLPYKVLYYKTSYNFIDIDYIKALECEEVVKEFALGEGIEFFHSVQLNIAVEMASRELGIPHLMDIYQLREDEFLLTDMDIYPHYHLCDSELYSERWRRMLGITSKCIRPLAPLGKIKSKDHAKADKYRIVMLGDVVDKKNQLAAIRAVEKCLGKYDLTLEIAGYAAGSYGDTCKKYVEEHGLSGKIHFLGFLSDIGGLLEKSDCLLCASTDESFPSSIVEAVTYDLTIVSTPVAGVPEVFTNKHNAYISRGYDTDDICIAITDCLDAHDDGSIVRIHKNAQNTWAECFSHDVVRNTIEEYYMQILEDWHKGKAYACDLMQSEELREIYAKMDAASGLINGCKNRALYYYFLKNVVKGRVYIWGAGKLGKCAYDLIRLIEMKVDIIAFIDREKTGEYCGVAIIKPDETNYSEGITFFISFMEGSNEVIDFLQGRGIVYNKKSFQLP